MSKPSLRRSALALAALSLTAAAASADEIVAVTSDGRLIAFDTANPAVLTRNQILSGVSGTVAAMDVRPRTGVLYAVTNGALLYRIDPATGAAFLVGSEPFRLGIGSLAGMAFENVDQIRVVNDLNVNLRVDPNNGLLIDGDPVQPGSQPDDNLVFSQGDTNEGTDPTVVAVAVDEAATVFGLDATLDILVRIDPASGGTLHTVGPLGVNIGSVAALDKSPHTQGEAFAVLTLPGQSVSGLYTVNLTTGGVAFLGNVGYPSTVLAAAVGPTSTVPPFVDGTLVGLTAGGDLVRFESDAPGTIKSRVTVTGLVGSDRLVAIDTRPSNGRLYGLSDQGRVYVINALTGAAQPVRMTPFEVPLEGTDFAFEFNPVTSKLRVISDTGQSFRVDPDTGEVIGGVTDQPVHFAPGDVNESVTPRVSMAAFDSNDARGSTSLFVIDATTGAFARLGSENGTPESPNAGRLHTLGALGIDASNVMGFEIVGDRSGFAVFGMDDGSVRLFRVDLDAGVTSSIGTVGNGETLIDVAVAPSSNPTLPATDLAVTRLVIRFDYARPDRDSIAIDGVLPFVGDEVRGHIVTIDVGGFARQFVLGKFGNSKDEGTMRSRRDDDVFRLADEPHDGHVKFTARLRREDVSDELTDEGMGGTSDARREDRTVQVTVTVDSEVFTIPVLLRYDARAGKSGTATTQRN